MRLINLKLRNFKGLTFDLDTKGRNTFIFGANDAGKTRLSDSFSWLLFGKDSRNQADFDIKTFDKNGDLVHGLEHEVEAILKLQNDKETTLKKVFKEKWTKKRGSATEKFSGHTTDHFINGVPVKQSEYNAVISEIAEEDIFKLLTNPLYFNEVLHWEKRRKILLEVCGDISDEDVINCIGKKGSAKERLEVVLGSRSIDDHRKTNKATQKKINEELKKIPVRIDEVFQSVSYIEDIDSVSIKGKINYRKSKVKEKQEELSLLESGGSIPQKKKQIAEIEADLMEIRNRHKEKNDNRVSARKERAFNIKGQIQELDHTIRSKENDLNQNSSAIERMEAEMKSLREEWHAYHAEEFTFSQEEVCPTCGQDIPQEQLEEARNKALSDFNLRKAERLEEINGEGKTLAEVVKEYRDVNQSLDAEIEEYQTKKVRLIEIFEEAQDELENLQKKSQDLSQSRDYIQKLNEKESLQQSIDNIRESIVTERQALQDEITSYEEEIAHLEKQLSQVDQYERGQKRIEELKDREKELAREYERLEEEIYLLEEFTRTKVSMLEEKINSQFKLAEFRLFEEQINGGIKEVCETLYNGVPYKNLDGSAPLKVGIDIINVLSDYYNFTAPMFVDNAERITDLPDSQGQMIALVVSEKDKELRVETHGDTEDMIPVQLLL